MCLGIPGQIVKITDANRQMALVDVSGVQREVSLECVVDDYFPLEKCVGHWALIHVGFAMSLINEGEAEATLKVLRELGEVQAELLAMKESAANPSVSGLVASALELVGLLANGGHLFEGHFLHPRRLHGVHPYSGGARVDLDHISATLALGADGLAALPRAVTDSGASGHRDVR